MLTVETRQNAKGNWWCNTTHLGYDIFEEGETIADAQMKMSKRLEKCVQICEVNWETPKLYPTVEAPVLHQYIVTGKPFRIDQGMV